ncbi:hypothetical protein FACS1894122_07100 [Alphaproteobacteria bacterium]|nr:hypothetical protein FACS1894122_07100 [Alphaproteobacteria bacterium]
MNKVLLSAAAGSLFCSVGFVNADHSVVSVHEEPVVVEQPSEPEPAPVEAAYVCPLTGFYVTAGIGGSFYKHKAEGGITESPNHNRFIGVLGLGGGKAFDGGFYAGLEALFDFGSSSRKGGVKISAVSPSLGLRLGYFNRNAETLFYTKVAASHSSVDASTVNNPDLHDKISKIAPAVALGVEKAFTKKISGRLEGEYRFGSKRTLREGTPTETKHKAAKGWNVRALVSYNINGL